VIKLLILVSECCDMAWSCRWLQTFQRNVLPPSTLKTEVIRNHLQDHKFERKRLPRMWEINIKMYFKKRYGCAETGISEGL
jgi:hypothetical protein